MSVLALRALVPEDAPQLAALEAAAEATPWSLGDFEDAFRAKRPGWALVDEADRASIAAWAVMMPVLDETELLIFGVRPALQRRGLGTALLLEIASRAKAEGFVCIHLEVRSDNEPAIGLYRKAGFEPVGRRRGYYLVEGKRIDALLMRLDLHQASLPQPGEALFQCNARQRAIKEVEA